MMSLEQARAAVLDGIRPAADTEIVALESAHGRFLAERVRAAVDNPVFDNSAMDGYALRVADLTAQRSVFPVSGESRCGDAPATLSPRTAMRIFTGAPIPAGADTVVIQEDIKLHGGNIALPARVQYAENIRRRGEDFRAGDMLYERGRRLSAFDLALMATAGVAEVVVYRRARALVIATGDELISPGKPLRPGQIYESNRLATVLQLRQLSVMADDGGTVADDGDALRDVLEHARDYDFVITSGGVSVGDHDLVKQVFSEIGEINFWKVKIKPGKPVGFGRVGERTHFFALPGNPVSSLVTFKLFVEPAIMAWHHAAPVFLELRAIAANGFQRTTGRTEFLRAQLYTENGVLVARALTGQGSHMMGTLRETNGYIRVDADSTGFDRGESVVVTPLTTGLF